MNHPSSLLPVADALALALAGAKPQDELEFVLLSDAYGRTLAQDLKAARTQPPFAASAMDGYALRSADLAQVPARLFVIGTSQAGRGFDGEVGPGQAVRIFTGAPVPAGADVVIIQENTERDGEFVVVLEREAVGRNIRSAGLDFNAGDRLLERGRRLGAADLSLAAAMNLPKVPVFRAPRVVLLATGDELVQPGAALGRDQIVASSGFAVSAQARAAGADCIDLGIAVDRTDAIAAGVRAAVEARADILVTLGGASVGDHDLVQRVLLDEGTQLDFWKIAMRPGKPLMFGRMGEMRVLGLPGNPVSAIVCSLLFLVPLVRALSGDPDAGADASEPAILGVDLPANDGRQDYLRSSLQRRDGVLIASPFSRQDSSMVRTLAASQALVIRSPHAPAVRAGDACRILRL